MIAKDENSPPAEMRLYINNENVDFSLSEQAPVQEFVMGDNL